MHIIYALFWHIQIIGIYKKHSRSRDLIDATRPIQQDDTIGSRSVKDEDMSYSDTRQTDET